MNKCVEKPWGSYTILEEGDTYQVKRLTVNPGAMLSLQLHKHRSETWVVVKGEAYVVCGDKEMTLKPYETISIPAETKHRLGNKGAELVEVIEVWCGKDLREDDIIRFEDKYNRNE